MVLRQVSERNHCSLKDFIKRPLNFYFAYSYDRLYIHAKEGTLSKEDPWKSTLDSNKDIRWHALLTPFFLKWVSDIFCTVHARSCDSVLVSWAVVCRAMRYFFGCDCQARLVQWRVCTLHPHRLCDGPKVWRYCSFQSHPSSFENWLFMFQRNATQRSSVRRYKFRVGLVICARIWI